MEDLNFDDDLEIMDDAAEVVNVFGPIDKEPKPTDNVKFTVENLTLEKNRIMCDPKHTLFDPYWNASHPSHKISVQRVNDLLTKINELESNIETPAVVEHPVTKDLDQEGAKAKLDAMKANKEVQAIFARGKKHPLYAKTVQEWTALHQVAFDQPGQIKQVPKTLDLDEGKTDLTELHQQDSGAAFMQQYDYVMSIVDRAEYFSDIEVAFWDLFEKFGDQGQRDEAEEKVDFYKRNHGNLADPLNRQILKNALTSAIRV